MGFNFQSEEEARAFLVKVRWGKWPSCPYCNNHKAYIIENGKRYKCANKLCYKKFSVTVKTLMEATNVSLINWIRSVCIYSESNGSCNLWDLEKQTGIKSSTAYHIKERLDFVWKYVLADRDSVRDVVKDVFQCLFNLYDKYSLKRKDYVLDEFDNISDIVQYRKLLKYTKYWLGRAHWLNRMQIAPEDLIAETFLYMADNNIKEYNAESVSFLIRKVSDIMRREWAKEHPEYLQGRKNYINEWARNNRRNLGDWYLTTKIKRNNPDKTHSEIRADRELLKEKKKRITEFRKKYNILYDFNSHFD